MTAQKLSAAAALEVLLHHQAAMLASRSSAHLPGEAATLKALSAKTPRLLARLLVARAEAVGREYALAAAQLQTRYLQLLAINNVLQRFAKGADLRSRDWARFFVPAFRSNPTPGETGYAADVLLSFDTLAASDAFEKAVTEELRSIRDLGITPSMLSGGV